MHVLGHEADLLLAAVDAVEELWLHGIEGLLQLLFRDGPDVLLERPVAPGQRAAQRPAMLRDSCWRHKHPSDLWYEFLDETRRRDDESHDDYEGLSEEILAAFKGWAVGRYNVPLTRGEIIDAMEPEWERRLEGVRDREAHRLTLRAQAHWSGRGATQCRAAASEQVVFVFVFAEIGVRRGPGELEYSSWGKLQRKQRHRGRSKNRQDRDAHSPN